MFPREKFSKRQKIVHTYGMQDEDLDTGDAVEEAKARLENGESNVELVDVEPPPGAKITIGGKKCKCGSTTHMRTSHKSCKFYKKKRK